MNEERFKKERRKEPGESPGEKKEGIETERKKRRDEIRWFSCSSGSSSLDHELPVRLGTCNNYTKIIVYDRRTTSRQSNAVSFVASKPTTMFGRSREIEWPDTSSRDSRLVFFLSFWFVEDCIVRAITSWLSHKLSTKARGGIPPS